MLTSTFSVVAFVRKELVHSGATAAVDQLDQELLSVEGVNPLHTRLMRVAIVLSTAKSLGIEMPKQTIH